jgi:uncharacterized protein YjbI with pentapeptide repeats
MKAALERLHRVARQIVSNPWTKTIRTYGETLGKIAIFFGVAAWLWEIPDRAQQRHDAAWTLINIAQGKPGEGGRKRALERLNNDGISLAGIDLSRAVLPEIDLSSANLKYANFQGSDLGGAIFGCSFLHIVFHHRCTDLSHVNFEGARLDKVNFRRALLIDATLSGPSGERNFETDFGYAALHRSTFENMTFVDANFSRANMRGGRFWNVRFIDPWNRSPDPDLFSYALFREVDFSTTNLTMQSLSAAQLCDVAMPDGSITNMNCEGKPNSSRGMQVK